MTTSRTRWGGASVALSMVAALGFPAAAGNAARPLPGPALAGTPASTPQLARSTSVTLVTGDRVVLSAGRVTAVKPAAGRERMTFRSYERDGAMYVVPADAEPLVVTGRVDRRLFDISQLVRFGYDDRRRSDVPLIVTYTAATGVAAATSRIRSAGGTVTGQVTGVGGLGVRAAKADLGKLWAGLRGGSPAALAAGVSRVYLDVPDAAGAHPEGSAQRIRAALAGTAATAADAAGRAGARMPARRLVAEPATLSMGTARWPYQDNQPVTRVLTYRNSGTAPISVDLALDVRGPNGAPAPAGLFALSAKRLRVPARGSASVTATADTRLRVPSGAYAGAVTASGGGTSIQTPLTVDVEVESYDVTLKFLDRARNATPNYYTNLVDVTQQGQFTGYDESGTLVVRVPAGTYYVESGVSGVDVAGQPVFDFFVEPAIKVTADMSLTFDAQQAKPLGFQVDRPGATGTVELMPSRTTALGPAGSTVFGPAEEIAVRPSISAAPGEFSFTAVGHLGRADGNGDFLGSPYQYHLLWTEDGAVPANLTRRFRDSELAQVKTVIAAQVPDRLNRKIYSLLVQPPVTVTELTTPGAAFFEDVFETDAANNLNWQIADLPRPAGAAGSVRTERWSVGPFGPSFASSPLLQFAWCGRFGDEMHFQIPHFSDQNPDHFGFSRTLAEEMRLFRNGQPVIAQDSEFGIFTVPPTMATYRLETRSTRNTSTFSTEVSGAWTFRSGHVAGSPVSLVPFSMAALRFAPALDQFNKAPSGQKFKVPLYLQPQQGAVVGVYQNVTVQASYNDGQTWLPAPVAVSSSGFVATLTHPTGTGYVSLRASATDTNGNKTELTIIHAYQLKI